ncbi:MAG: hypothetical protein Q9169_004449 [Polycauliona sp. 2 TL-2023]
MRSFSYGLHGGASIGASILFLILCIQSTIGTPTSPPWPKADKIPQIAPSNRPAELIPRTSVHQPGTVALSTRQVRGQDIKIIFRRFVKFAAVPAIAVGVSAASSGGIPPILDFLAKVASSLRSHTFFNESSTAIDIFYGGLRLYVSLFDKNGVAVTGITKINEVVTRVIEVVETLAGYARRGYAGFCEGLTPLRIAVGSFTLGFILAPRLYNLYEDYFGGLPALPPPHFVPPPGNALG